MDNTASPQAQDQPTAPAAEAEVLKPRTADEAGQPSPATQAPLQSPTPSDKKGRRRTYRPSHKATFIGLAVVIAILAVNAAVLWFVIKKQSKQEDLFNKGQVSISTNDLNRLGINRSLVGDSGVELVVAPDAQFKSKLSVGGESTFAGQVSLNGKVLGTSASFTQLQSGDTALSKLNVNGDTTISNLNLRKNLVVAGQTHLQGPVTLEQLLTINNSLTITGNLTIGGKLNVSTFGVRRVISIGSPPAVGRGSALGSNGTVSLSGNDVAGTIAINIGTGASGGTLASVAFRTQYSTIPVVVISPVGVGGSFYLSNISVSGFSVAINSGLSPGGYKINYFVIE